MWPLVWEEPFVGARCIWKRDTSPRFPLGYSWGPSFWEGLRSWVALLVEWRKAEAVLTEEDEGLASASKKDQEDAVTEAFPSMREASGSEAEVIFPDPCPWAGVPGPVTSLLVGKSQIPGYILSPAVPFSDMGPFLWGTGP